MSNSDRGNPPAQGGAAPNDEKAEGGDAPKIIPVQPNPQISDTSVVNPSPSKSVPQQNSNSDSRGSPQQRQSSAWRDEEPSRGEQDAGQSNPPGAAMHKIEPFPLPLILDQNNQTQLPQRNSSTRSEPIFNDSDEDDIRENFFSFGEEESIKCASNITSHLLS